MSARLALLTVVLASGLAQAQLCMAPAGWRPPMVQACQDQAFSATAVNSNFGQLTTWLEAKVGAVGTPAVLPADLVTTSALANGAVTNPKLATASVGSLQLAAGSLTSVKFVDGGVPLYTVASGCFQTAGTLTFNTQCQYQTVVCGSTCGPLNNLPTFGDCSGGCSSCAAPLVCNRNNTLVELLVPP